MLSFPVSGTPTDGDSILRFFGSEFIQLFTLLFLSFSLTSAVGFSDIESVGESASFGVGVGLIWDRLTKI